MRQIRRYTKSGEHFACDPTEHTMSAMLHKSELDKPMSDYELDHDLTAADLENSTVIREEYLPSRAAWVQFAADALQGIVAAENPDSTMPVEDAAKLAAAYADALSAEYARRCANGRLK